MNALNIRSWADARAFVHVAAPVLAVALVASGVADATLAGQIVTLVLAVFSPALATVNTASGFRTWFYAVLAAASVIAVGLGYWTEVQYATWLPVIVLLIGPAVAAANTPTTIDGEAVSVEDHEITTYNQFGDPI